MSDARARGLGRAALVLVALGVLFRVALFVASSPQPSRRLLLPDSLDYDRLARNLRAGHGFSLEEAPPFRPDTVRTPVYPLFLAAVAALGGSSLRAGVAAGLLLSCAAIWLVWMAARVWLPDPRAGDLAAIFVALDLGSAAYANFLLTESLFVVLLLSAFVLLGRAGKEAGVYSGLATGLLLGLATLCRPIALGLPLILSIGRRRAAAAGILAGAVIIVAPWVVRNAVVAGVVNVSSVFDVNLYHHRGRAILDDQRGVKHEAPARPAGATDPRQLDRLRREGWSVILGHPVAYLRLTLFAWLRTFGPDEDPIFQLLGVPWDAAPWWLSPRQGSRQPPGLSTLENSIEAVFLIALYGAATLAWRRVRDASRRPLLLTAGAVVLYFLAVSGPEYYGRFRVPILPFLALMAEGGLRRRRGESEVERPSGPSEEIAG